MLTAEKLKVLTELGPHGLAVFLEHSGYTGASFKSVQFVGLTNGGQFAYRVVYFDETGTGKEEVGKVFVTYDHTNEKIIADY